jgi:phytol kinase
MWPLRLAFASFDRKEDRPLTLVWAVTQALFVYIVMLPCLVLLTQWNSARLILIPLIVTGVGDGIAEPIGRAWGYHKYKTSAMCTTKLYTRSIEGSLAIAAVAVVVVCAMYAGRMLTTTQFLLGIGTFPVWMPVAEAVSPHSWDNPFLLGVGGALTFALAAVDYYT